MKKSIFTLILFMIGVASSIGQINITAKGRVTNTILAADSYCCVVKSDNNYEIKVSLQNKEGSNMINILLGSDEVSALNSLTQIENWLEIATISEYLILEQNGEKITLYKSHANRFMVSKGDQYYCKQIMTTIASGWDTKNALPYGYCTNVIIKKAIKTLSQQSKP